MGRENCIIRNYVRVFGTKCGLHFILRGRIRYRMTPNNGDPLHIRGKITL